MMLNNRLFPIRNRRFLFLKSFISKVFDCKTDRLDISITSDKPLGAKRKSRLSGN